jgi:TolA-binding protein
MKYNKLIVLVAVITITACIGCNKEGKKQEKIKVITAKEKEFFQSVNKGQMDYAKGREIIDLYKDYIITFPKDTIVPYMYYKGGLMYLQYLADINESIACFEKLKEEYPKFKQTPVAVFTLAYIYSDRKKNGDKAKEYYKFMIDNYPNDSLTLQAKVLYDNIGKTDEDLWNYVQQQNKSTENKAN